MTTSVQKKTAINAGPANQNLAKKLKGKKEKKKTDNNTIKLEKLKFMQNTIYIM